jgi:hypothetical protein
MANVTALAHRLMAALARKSNKQRLNKNLQISSALSITSDADNDVE